MRVTAATHSRPQHGFAETWASVLLDLARGLAALVVLLSHWRMFFFTETPGAGALGWVVNTAAAAGHQAVIVFFVLSGYLVGGSAWRSMEGGTWSWRGYLLRRLTRLWVVLLPALLLCLLWDKLGLHLGHAPLLYSGQVAGQMIANTPALLTPRIFAGNLFFLQHVLVPTFGSDGPLWSIANEFWYYVLFPLGALIVARRSTVRGRVVCAVLLLGLAFGLRRNVLPEFPIWLAGAALSRVRPLRLGASLRAAALCGAGGLYAAVFFSVARMKSVLLADYLLCAATLLLFWLLLGWVQPHPRRSARVNACRELARFSYTLYAVHLPLLLLLTSVTLGDRRMAMSPAALLRAALALPVVLLYAYAVAWVTEFRTDAVRRRLEPLVGLRPSGERLPSNPLERAS